MTQTVILAVGISGSGKSTRINNAISKHKELNQTYGVCSADFYWEKDGPYKFDPMKLGEAHKYSQKTFQKLLEAGTEFIYVDNTCLTSKERTFYLKEATRVRAGIIAWVLPANVDLSEQRNIHNVPRATLERQASKMDLKPGMYIVTHIGDSNFQFHRMGDLE